MGRRWYLGGMIRRLGGEGGRYNLAEAFRDEKRAPYAMEVWSAWSVGLQHDVVKDTN